MYAETGLMFPYFQNYSSDVQQFDDFFHTQKSIACLGNLVQTSTISDYDLGGEGDLFKAPEPIIEPLMNLDPMTSAISMISCGEDAISAQELKVTDIESLQNEEFLSDVFYECKNILAKEAATGSSPLSEVLSFSFPATTDENTIAEDNNNNNNIHPPCQIPKSLSSDSLNSMDWIHGAQIKPNFLNFSELDFGNVYGMRRAFSEGDIKTLADANTSLVRYPLGQPQLITEDRMQKLSRYRNKKTKRNFGRKIKYACRKALADSQPRIRGRFAKTDEYDILRK